MKYQEKKDVKMNHFIPRHLLTVNKRIHKDPVMLMCMQKLFEWANEAGLKGQKVYGLFMQDPDPTHPMDGAYRVWCKVECTEEQRKLWEMQRVQDIEHAVLTSLKEE